MAAVSRPVINAQLMEQAITWQVHLLSGENIHYWQDACLAWRKSDPEHEKAWQVVQQAQHFFGDVPDTIKPLAGQTLRKNEQQRQVNRQRRTVLKALGIAAVASPGILAWKQYQGYLWSGADYATATGEQRNLVLADGSILWLNTGTQVDVRETGDQTQLVLHRGELLVDTTSATNSASLQLISRNQAYRISSGSLMVRQYESHDYAYLLAGSAQVQQQQTAHSLMLSTGVFVGAGGIAPYLDTTFDPTGWLDGALVARFMPLGDFVAELSRYHRGWLRCDPAVASLKVSGVYQLGDTNRVLATLANVLPVRASRIGGVWTTLTQA